MKTILILFGGCSSEYSVSLQSAYGVLSHMDPARFRPLMVAKLLLFIICLQMVVEVSQESVQPFIYYQF